MIHKKTKWIVGGVVTIFFISFITVKMDCNKTKNEIVSLKMKKRIIEDNLKVMKLKEEQLLTKNRIEKIATEKLGMYSPEPESLIVVIR